MLLVAVEVVVRVQTGSVLGKVRLSSPRSVHAIDVGQSSDWLSVSESWHAVPA